MQKNLRMSKKSSNFARFFVEETQVSEKKPHIGLFVE